MGAITDQEQHEKDVAELMAIADSVPVYRRHLSHHLRNCLAGIVGSCDLAQQDIAEKRYEAVQNHLRRLMVVCDHLRKDLEEAGI